MLRLMPAAPEKPAGKPAVHPLLLAPVAKRAAMLRREGFQKERGKASRSVGDGSGLLALESFETLSIGRFRHMAP